MVPSTLLHLELNLYVFDFISGLLILRNYVRQLYCTKNLDLTWCGRQGGTRDKDAGQ